MKLNRFLEVLIEIYFVLFGLLCLLVLGFSVLTTVVFRQYEENDLFDYVPENIPLLLLLMAAVFAAALLIRRAGGFDHAAAATGRQMLRPGPWCVALLVFAAAFGAFLICSIRGLATNDAKMLDEVINQFNEGDYSSLTNGYLTIYPFQIGYVAAGQIVSRIAGASNYYAYQFLDVVMILLGMWCLYEITWEIFHRETAAEMMAFLGLGAWFLYAYSTYVYNDIWSVGLQMSSFYLFIRYLRRRTLPSGIGCAVLTAVSCCLKGNCKIGLVAMILTLLIACVRETVRADHSGRLRRILRHLLIGALLIVFTIALDRGIKAWYMAKAGIDTWPNGVPNMNYYAMGMQEMEHKYGWYDGYNAATYVNNGFDVEASESIARQEIHDRLVFFSQNKKYFVKFYLFKFLSQWGDETCASLRNLEETARHVENQPAIAQSICFGSIYRIMQWVMNVYQSVIYLLVLVYLGALSGRLHRARRSRKKNSSGSGILRLEDESISLAEAFLVMHIIGGMIFHQIWEASSRYILRYYLTMLPLAAGGLDWLCSRIQKKMQKVNSSSS